MNTKLKIYFVFFILFFITLHVHAQNISFVASGPGAVEVGEQFTINYKINAQATGIKPPSFAPFDFLGGPSQSSMYSSSYSNGRSVSSTEYTYSYYLQANKPGKYSIDGAVVTIGGKSYKSNSIIIEVAGGSKSNQQSTNNSNTTSNEANIQQNGNTFIITSINKNNLYQGESTLLTIKLYTKERLAGLADFKPGQLTGFWKEEIDIGEIKAVRETYNGQVYNSVLLSKMLIFPQKSGKLIIPSFKINASIQAERTRAPRDYAEQMWYGNKVRELYNKEVNLKSNPINISVKELPQNQKPANFNGLVGNFTIVAKPDRLQINANDAINFSVTVNGTGNLNLLEPIKPNFPADFEVYDPKTIDKTSAGLNGYSGSKTYEYLLIPRNEGTYTIPSIELSYFDINSGTYKTLNTNEFIIKVGKGNGKNQIVTTGIQNQNEIKLLNSEIRYIETKAPDFSKKSANFLFSFNFWLLLFLLPLLTILGIILFLKTAKQRSNKGLMKHKKATKTARKRLKKAKTFLQNNQRTEFYNEISAVLWGYLSDKFYIPLADLSIDNAKSKLIDKNANESAVEKYIKTLEEIEFARFGPNQKAEILNQIYEAAFSSITEVEKSLKA